MQKKGPQGNMINHGEYYKKDSGGNILLRGKFVEGKKHGRWTQYDEKGKKKVEKVFEKGVEK